MSLFIFLTVVQAIIAAGLVGVVLMQRSEGGGLGVGGSPSGMMSARGAADFLTRTTKWLAVAFVTLSIVLAALAVETSGGSSIETTLDRTPVQSEPDPLAAPAAPVQAPAVGSAAGPSTEPLTDPATAPAQAPGQ